MSPSFLIKIQAPFHQKTLHDLPSCLSSHLSPNRQVLIGSLPLLFCLPALPGWFFLFLSLQSPTQLLRFSLCSSAKKASPSIPSTFGPWCSSLLFIPAPAILYCLTHLPPASLQPFGEGVGNWFLFSRTGKELEINQLNSQLCCSQASYHGNLPSLGLSFSISKISRSLGKASSWWSFMAFPALAFQESMILLLPQCSHVREIDIQSFFLGRVCMSHNSSEDCPQGCRWLSALPDARENLSLQKSLWCRFSKCGVLVFHLSRKHDFAT